jgi:hypothetical protein
MMRGTNASSPKRRAIELTSANPDPPFNMRQRARNYFSPASTVASRNRQPQPPFTHRRSVHFTPPKRRRTSHDNHISHPSAERHVDDDILRLHRQRLEHDARTPSLPFYPPPPPRITITRAPRQYPRPVRQIQRPQGVPSSSPSDDDDSNINIALPPLPKYNGPVISIVRPRTVAQTPNIHRTVHFSADVRFGVELDLSSDTDDTSFSVSTPSSIPSPDLQEVVHLDADTVQDPPTIGVELDLLSDTDNTSFSVSPPSPITSPESPEVVHPDDDTVQDPPTPNHITTTIHHHHTNITINNLHNNNIIQPPPLDHEAPNIPEPIPIVPNLPFLPATHPDAAPPVYLPSNPKPQQVLLCTYNIVSGRGSRLIAAIRALEVMHVDVAILTEAKITDNIYPRQYMVYTITATTAPSIHQGGIALAWRQRNGYSIESVIVHGPNMLSFQLVSSGYRWLIVAVYMSPNIMATDICEQLIQIRNKYTNLPIIVTGDINVNLTADNFNQRDQDHFDTMEMIGVTNMMKYFANASTYMFFLLQYSLFN